MSSPAVRRDAPQRIREALASTTGGRTVRELAEATLLHVNAVRRALATLAAEGSVSVERRRPRGRGRPQLLYRLVGAPDEPFRAILPMVLALLGSSPPSAEVAYATGFASGAATPAPGAGGTREALVASLVNYGFAPVERTAQPHAGAVLDLTRCPFRDAVTGSANGRQICHLHHGLLAGVAAAAGGELFDFAIHDPRSAPCRARFRERRGGGPAEPSGDRTPPAARPRRDAAPSRERPLSPSDEPRPPAGSD
jgi:predicted ArsR family transcriptional regulator